MLVLYSLSCHSAKPQSVICPCLTRRLRKSMRTNDGPRAPSRPSDASPQVKDAPVSHKQATCFPTAADRNIELGKEVKRYVVGPMPVKAFLDKYVPKPNKKFLGFDAKEAQDLEARFMQMTDEKDMYPQLIEWMQQ